MTDERPTVAEHESEQPPRLPGRPVFAHPPWMTGVVLVFGLIALVAGFANPIWWVIGFPAILVLVVDLLVRIRRLF